MDHQQDRSRGGREPARPEPARPEPAAPRLLGALALRLRRVGSWLDRLYLSANRGLRGYPALLVRVGQAFSRHEGALLSASLAYYALFSFFPLILLIIVVGSNYLTAMEAKRLAVNLAVQFAPGAAELVSNNVEQVLRQRGTIGAVAGLGLLWSSSGVFGAIYRAVNRAWGENRPSQAWQGRLFGLAATIIVGLLFFLSVALTTALTVIQSWRLPVLGWQPFLDPAVTRLAGWLWSLSTLLVTVGLFSLLYRILPRAGVAWRDVWLGGIAAGLAWQLARLLFTWYLSFVRYNLVYGSLGAIVAFLLWSYLSALILLLGAELTAQFARWRRQGRPIDNRLPRQMREESPNG